jgi:hypothetical protein
MPRSRIEWKVGDVISWEYSFEYRAEEVNKFAIGIIVHIDGNLWVRWILAPPRLYYAHSLGDMFLEPNLFSLTKLTEVPDVQVQS